MGATSTLAVNSSTATAIYPTIRTLSIRIAEDASVANWPTTDLLIYKGSLSNQPIRIPAGQGYNFLRGGEGIARRYFDPDQDNVSNSNPAGWVKTVSGTTTLYQDEDGF